MHTSKFFPKIQGIFYNIFIKILKNWPTIVIFHWFVIKKFPNFSGVRGFCPWNPLELHNSNFSPNFREKFEKFFKKFWKNSKILKNCPKIVIFHWFLIKNVENFSGVREAPPPGTPTRRPHDKPLALSKTIPPPDPRTVSTYG